MSTTLFKCSRCGYENKSLHQFKNHLKRKTECKPKESDIPFEDVKQQFQHLLVAKSKPSEPIPIRTTDPPTPPPSPEPLSPIAGSPQTVPTVPDRRRRRRKVRNFGDECRDYMKRESYKEYVEDPLKGIQEIIKEIYFNEEHEENATVRSIAGDSDAIEIHFEDGWVKRSKTRIYDKMIYRAAEILENCINKKLWTPEFLNFISGMGEIENEDLLELIREEVDNTILHAENEANLK